jgi:hypothetical protein
MITTNPRAATLRKASTARWPYIQPRIRNPINRLLIKMYQYPKVPRVVLDLLLESHHYLALHQDRLDEGASNDAVSSGTIGFNLFAAQLVV